MSVKNILNKNELAQVVSFTILLILIGLLLISQRWINPDEGAHLADGKLLLEGNIPVVDFQSRQPFYVVQLALFLKIFGMSFVSGRLLILLCCAGNSILFYLIAKRLFDSDTGKIAQILYIFFPFTIMYCTIVKMPNVMLFWMSLGIFMFLVSQDQRKLLYLFLSGLFIGLAFYVRESSLAGFAALVIMLVIINGRKLSRTIVEILTLSSGFLVIVSVIMIFYLNFMSWNEFLNSPLNPAQLFFQSLAKFIYLPQITVASEELNKIRLAGQNLSVSMKEVRAVFRMNLYLILGFTFFLVLLVKDILSKKSGDNKNQKLRLLIPVWAFFSSVLYLYYFWARGFFPAYAVEVYPPLIIGMAWLWKHYLYKSDKGRLISILLIITLAYLFYGFLTLMNQKTDFSVVFLIAALIWLITKISIKEKEFVYKNKLKIFIVSAFLVVLALALQLDSVTRILPGRYGLILVIIIISVIIFLLISKKLISTQGFLRDYLVATLLVGALAGSFGESAQYLNLKYDGAWSPKTVKAVHNHFTSNAKEGETILSGGMIWSIHPKVAPYLMIAHPTSYLSEVETTFVEKLENEIKNNPPDYIIYDGYTRRCYQFLDRPIDGLVIHQYSISRVFGDETNPVQLFKKVSTRSR